MAAPIGKGDWVECIVECNDNSPGIRPHWLCGAQIERGRVYTVLRVITGVDNLGVDSVGLVLVEPDTHWPSPALDGEFGSWAVEHFRPIYRRDESLIASLKAPPIRVRKTEDA